MPVRVDPAVLAEFADDLRNATGHLHAARPPTEADAGPSSAAVASAVAELARSAVGLAETTLRAATDLDTNRAVYADVPDTTDSERAPADAGHLPKPGMS